MAAARLPPASEPQKVQLRRPMAMPLRARSAALLKGMMLSAPRLGGADRSLRSSLFFRPDRSVGSTKRWQAVISMSCELALLLGRPYDLPGCAASADP